MHHQPTILAFAGSVRKESYNKKLVKIAVKAAEKAGAIVTYVDLNDYQMPIYDADYEEVNGLPENARKFKQLLKEHNGILIASPEYNSAISPLLKNAIDWATRPEPGETPLICFKNKLCCLLSASPGKLGGMRGLACLRSILGNINVFVLPYQLAVPNAMEVFDDENNIKDSKLKAEVEKIGTKLALYLVKIYG